MKPTDLRVEHVDFPLGITTPRPRLSWRLPAGAQWQLAYQVRAGTWDSGWVESDQSLLVRYGGPELRSRQRVDWTVRLRTDTGVTDWAESSWWEMGLTDAGDWLARWIEPVEDVAEAYAGPRPAHILFDLFSCDAPVARARLYITAHGIYECFLNGQRVGDMELTPGFTSYGSTLHVQTFDVTDLVKHGDNDMSVVVSDGWFRGQNGGYRLVDVFGPTVGLLAQVDVVHTDGSTSRRGTGPRWRSRTSRIRAADLIEGQTIDFGRPPDHELLDRLSTSRVCVRDVDLSRLRASPAPPVRRVAELRPTSITQRPNGQVVDLGQNLNGWIRLNTVGTAGSEVTLIYGEALDRKGDVTQDNLIVDVGGHPSFDRPELSNLSAPLQVDRLIAGDQPDVQFEPRHTTHGFRYVQIDGHSEVLGPDDVSGVVVHSDLRRTGWFECSDERLNRLHEATVWSFRGNACDIPTDCPTRERAGWTGDWQVFAPAAAFIFDVAGFAEKWLHDLASEQRPDGLVLDCVPSGLSLERAVELGIADRSLWWPGSAGWGDAAVIVPWEIYRAYGDRDILEKQWDSMTSWVRYAARTAKEQRHPHRVANRPIPAPHDEFLWDSGFHYGEWLEPGVWDLGEIGANLADLAATDHGAVATAYLHLSARLLGRIAKVLERDDDTAAHYTRLAAATRAAWSTEFVRSDGTLVPGTQATYVRALSFDLVPVGMRPRLAQRLVDLVREAGTHLGTGFLATPSLLPVLADTGHLDVAYELLLRDSEPSWLTMIDRGATTVWEAWNGIDDKGDAHLSLNHYSKGAVISFLHRYVAGIVLLDSFPAYRRFRVAPRPGGGITWANAAHESPYGRIESSWRVDGDQFTLAVAVPAGTVAEVRLPDGRVIMASPGRSTFSCEIGQRQRGHPVRL